MFVIFLECVKITSVGLKLDRPQPQHLLLFLEHNRSENSNVVAGLPVPIGYGCVYDSACDFNACSSSFRISIMQTPALIDLRGCTQDN